MSARVPRSIVLLRRLLRGPGAEEAIGDLCERFTRMRRTRGALLAHVWYWRELVVFGARVPAAYVREVFARGSTRSPSPDLEDRMTALLDDFRQALRGLRAAPSHTITATLTLALGSGASIGVFGVVRGGLLRPLDYDKPSELMAVSETIQHYRDVSVSPVVFAAWRDGNSSFSELAGGRGVRRNLATPERPERIDGAIVTRNFFRALGVSPSLGRVFDDSDRGDAAVPSIILDHALWSSRFGADPDLIGATIRLDGASHRVVGVMPPTFDLRFPSPQQFWIAGVLDTAAAQPGMASYKYHWLRVFGRLRAAALADTAAQELEAITARLAVEDPDWHDSWGANVRPLQTAMTGSVASSVYLIFAAALFLILVGAVNVANLMLVRVIARQRELSLRMALDADGWRACSPWRAPCSGSPVACSA